MKNDQKLVSIVIVTKDRKKDLVECINSYLNSSYKTIEIVVVDNASLPSLSTWVPEKYPKIKLISSDKNLGAAAGRNLGLANTLGKYIIFTDDDAYADKDMVKFLVSAFEKKPKVGIIQPLVYDKNDKNMLQGAGHDINLITSRISASGVKERDIGQYEGIREVAMCGCVWMVKREVFDRIGNYDEDYFIPYEDSDFSIRCSKANYKLYCYSAAKTWHQGAKITYVNPRIEWLGITSAERAYRVVRNKMIFMRKHSPFPKSLIFFFILLPIYIIIHSLIIASCGKWSILARYWRGFFSGLGYCLNYTGYSKG